MAYLKELKIRYERKRVKDSVLGKSAKSSERIYELFKWMGFETREIAICLHLSHQLKILSYEMVGMGDARGLTLDIQGVFRGALLGMASSIVLLHNHPHGNKRPSKKDIRAFDSLRLIGELHTIKLQDFMIINENGYCSFEEKGLI